MKRPRLRFAWWAGALLAGLAVALAAGHVLHKAQCAATLPAVDPPAGRSRFLGCTNIEQRFVPSGADSLAAKEPGWSLLTPTEDAATVRVTLRKSTDRAVFYPRVSGPAGKIAVYELIGSFRKELFRLSRTGEGWTGIGVQYPVCLACVENGWSAEEFPVTLEIVLQGRGTQLWHKDDIIFFEAP